MKKHLANVRNTCRVCLGETLENVFSLQPTPVSDDYLDAPSELEKFPLDLMLCPSCAHLQLAHVVAAQGIYEENIYWTQSSPGLMQHFHHYAASVAKDTGFSSGLMVDIGCNDGMLLKEFRDLGFSVCGVEPAKNIAKYLKEKEFDVVNDYFSKEVAQDILENFGKARIITTNNTFANVDDLYGFLSGVGILLADEGVFVVEAAQAKAMFETMVFDNIYHEHLNYFSLHSLKQLCFINGLKLVHAEKIDTKGGSIRAYFKKESTYNLAESSVNALLDEEIKIGVHSLEVYKSFFERINKIGALLKAQLINYKLAGKKICGYGASSTVTTVLHHFHIGDLLDYLVDDNPIKHGRYSPGFNLKVYPSRQLLADKPDVVLIIPWRFEEMIIQKNAEYLKNGGVFLTFMPELKEVVDA